VARKRAVLLVFLAFPLFSFAEGQWLSEIPKAEQAKISASFKSLASKQKTLKADYDSAVRAEAAYARKARVLSRELDPDEAGGDEADRAALADLRRLRWESARELASRAYGRAGPKGFESAPVLEASLKKEGDVFSSLLSKHLSRLSRKALSSLTADLEARAAAHPDIPTKAFAALREAASSLGAADRRLWIGALAAGLPSPIWEAFVSRLPPAAGAVPEAFAAALEAYSKQLEASTALRELLPAAAAAAWYSDSRIAPIAPAAAASLASFSLGGLDSADIKAVLAEWPELDLAFSEWSALLWLAFDRNPGALASDAGMDGRTAKAALKAAWMARSEPAASAARSFGLPDARAAERMAVYAENVPDHSPLLSAFASLRLNAGALEAFAVGSRYAAARERVLEAYLAAESSVADSVGSSILSRAKGTLFGRVLVSARSGDGRALAPERFVPSYAAAMSRALGRRGPEAEASSWMEERGFHFVLPFLAEEVPPGPEELEALGDGLCFHPAKPGSPGAAAARADLIRSRIAGEAAKIGVPLRFVLGNADSGRSMAVFYSYAPRFAADLRGRGLK